MRLRKGVIVAASALVLVATAACSGTGQPTSPASGGGGGAGTYGYKFSVITHGAPGDTFWDVVKKGAEKAGSDEGVSVNYQASGGDPAKQAQLIDAAVNEKVDGIVVSMANPDALQASIRKAVDAGIPVITINSGQDKSKEFGAIAHVGQDEVIAGRGAGEQMRAAGVTKALCVIQEAGNIGLEQRCQGFREGLGGEVENLQVENSNPSGAEATIKAKLQTDPSINGVLTLGPVIGAVAIKAVADSGSSAKLATFDLNADVTQAIADGRMLFAVDQQQYTQGYLPIVMLTLYKSNLNTIGGGQPVLTGPGYVTQENAAQVQSLAAQGTR
ncbi:monosaccharide ABC transporter substrate-binding protein, CUT2 family [Pseudonocardia thermophila]|jgi:ABC-type sugar transport system, periplasmic component|uniref:Monosaccharide ABC transporter substrate-binding protein, CUT2 family n=1 Tax=Pseudonocardia thermophila TaxID=1848 RepID=A0A1M6P939_PSETH|nr:sugar ABC transporter substrate-binding protein [Pseudonocardia thermophila]SHK04458.1 monosaccharide ABC transporter substrate-binding protein, CUT2 family [Pseudonocardia thermophila]